MYRNAVVELMCENTSLHVHMYTHLRCSNGTVFAFAGMASSSGGRVAPSPDGSLPISDAAQLGDASKEPGVCRIRIGSFSVGTSQDMLESEGKA